MNSPARSGLSHTATTWALFLSLVFGVVVVVAAAMAAGWSLALQLAPVVEVTACPEFNSDGFGTLAGPCEGP